MSTTTPDEVGKQRQVVFWRLLAAANGASDQARNVEAMTGEIAEAVGLPKAVLDPVPAIETVVQRYPELKPDFADLDKMCAPREADDESPPDPGDEPPSVRRALCFSKLLLNAFGPNTMSATVTAQQYNQWCQDVARLEEMFGYAPGQLRGKRGGTAGPGASASGAGAGHMLSEEQLQAGLSAMEGDLIRRMALREVLQDDRMAAKLTPSLPLLEQLLHDKANLSGNALKNAKDLIRRYVDQLAEVLRLQVMQTVKGKLDRSVPPKRVFRNLDLKRTVWKNLTNYNPDENRLYVNQLYFRQTAKKTTPTRLIVVVDQSGSMVDAMVQCTILASIFASLPKVEVHLFAFDTRVINLTPWVHDPFEVLMRTQLGGGTLINKALLEAMESIEEPRNTGLVLISDFYEGGSNEELFKTIKGLKDSGVRFIPVGAVTSSGYFSVNDWFRARLKELGTPVLSGSVKKLIEELKSLL